MKLSNIFKFTKRKLRNQKRFLSMKSMVDEGYMNEAGMTLIEVILIAVFLAAIAVSTSYFFNQNKAVMRSSSQVMRCQTIVKQALENTVSLGTRLYGYKIHHSSNSNLNYTPLFITKKSAKAYDVDGNIKDAGDGSQLNFPSKMYQDFYKNLVGMDIDPPIKTIPKNNTGKPIINDALPVEISTSTLLVNSINALQYLYNSDPAYSTGDGKHISASNELMSSSIYNYKQRFNLDNIQFYVKIMPIKNDAIITTRPVLTRPRFPVNSNAIPSDLHILGDKDITFEIKVKLKYELNGQEFTCDGMHRFHHQMTGKGDGVVKALNVDLKALKNGAGQDLATNSLLNTSCDTHGNGYEDIILELDFNTVRESQEAGTVILCQMNSYCKSEGDDRAYGSSCSPEEGPWQRCHNIQPKPGSDQSWTLKSKLKAKQVLTLQFDDMKKNRRYDLNIAEFTVDGEMLRSQVVVFYIDAKRPVVDNREFTDNNVGTPIDGIKGRYYEGPFTDWKKPDGSSHGKWLQCNTEPVSFRVIIDDQFTHNLKNCNITWTRRDGNGTTSSASITPIFDAPNRTCGGTLNTIQHGRQTVTFEPKDTCEPGPWDTGNLVWDTDLPSSFEAQNFTSNPEWLFSTDKDAYAINTVIPAKNNAGKFPKHYSVTCDDNFQGRQTRKDGNSGVLKCELSGSVPAHDDGCNLKNMGVKYYHVCGGTENNCNHSKKKNWGVYAPHGESCVNVQCEPGLSCCDASSGTCNGVNDKECGDAQTRHCANPKGGAQSKSDEIPSGCPPLGLNDCIYQLSCEATSPCSETGPISACDGLRQGDSCSYKPSVICSPDDTNWNDSCEDSGTYTIGCRSGTCTASCEKTCKNGHQGSCDTNGVCTNSGNSCTNNDDCCDDHLHQARPTTISPHTFTGTCGVSSGGCLAKPQGGGNLSQEQCDQRNPICTSCDSSTTCCPGDSHPSNPNCPVCNSTTACCPGDYYPNNLNCCNPATDPNCPAVSECVRINGAACCAPSQGGICTGTYCITSDEECRKYFRCHVRDIGDGICRPSCNHLGSTNESFSSGGPDCKVFTGDEYLGTSIRGGCAAWNRIKFHGYDNWRKVTGLPDPYEVAENAVHGAECCIADPGVTRAEILQTCNPYILCVRNLVYNGEGFSQDIPFHEVLRIIAERCDQYLPPPNP